MIYYLTAGRQASLMADFLAAWGRQTAGRVTILAYEDLAAKSATRLGRGTYIFTSLGDSLGERQPPSPARAWAMRLHAALTQQFGPSRVLNHPLGSLRRLELLQTLRRHGINGFDACAAAEAPSRLRCPMFLRGEHGTVWSEPRRLGSREAVEEALREPGPPDRIAIEFCDTADALGVYRKYGCFVVGERLVPRHLFFSRSWLVKSADLLDAGRIEEELAFLAANPHADALARACRLAGIGYGRIDYAVLEGRPQIWEINTTPQLATPAADDAAERRPVHEAFSRLLADAFDAIDPPG